LTAAALANRPPRRTKRALPHPQGDCPTSSLRFRAYDFRHLSIGDVVEARCGDAVDHSGIVVEALASLGLFWLRDSGTGARRIIDFESFDIWYARPFS
jgi:hypothetical protein